MITFHTNFNDFIAKYKKHDIIVSYYKNPSVYVHGHIGKSIRFSDNLHKIELLDPYPNELKYVLKLQLVIEKKSYSPIFFTIIKNWDNRNDVLKLTKQLYSNKKGSNHLSVIKISYSDLNLENPSIYKSFGKSIIKSIIFEKKNRHLFIEYVNNYNSKAINNYIDIISIISYMNPQKFWFVEIYYQYICIDPDNINLCNVSTKEIIEDDNICF